MNYNRLKNGKTGIIHAMRTDYRTLCGLAENEIRTKQKGTFTTGEITCGKCKQLRANRKASR